MKNMVENGVSLELATVQRTTAFGLAYWQALYSFPTGSGTARLHGTTVDFHPSEDEAELAAILLARGQGWGAAACRNLEAD